ncbi:MAG: flagellar biosynthesis repressor FlbT [Rhodospirillales bacterium]|nr:flagellar biosynthesis repressor FlbT [Rhodospirillales bacterium]
MPLKLDFKAGDKMVINGAVVENIGHNASLLIHNEAAILREKEILSEAETATPAARVYFALQCAYIFSDRKEHYLSLFRQFLDDYMAAAPSSRPIGEEILAAVDGGRVYKGLKLTQKLIGHEIKTFEGLHQSLKAHEHDFDAEPVDADE